MNVSHIIVAAALATSLAGISIANAAENNPLQPNYYWDKTQVTSVPNNAADAVAAPITNPLHPGYFANKVFVAPFVATGASQPRRYVDERNPLHPSYHRS
jgi:hypothetical protein